MPSRYADGARRDDVGTVTEYGFDASGNMVTQEDALHRMTHYEFDVTGRRTARELPLGQRETFTYGIDGAMRGQRPLRAER